MTSFCQCPVPIKPSLSVASRVGENVMFHLLSETSIYVPLPNNCLCQLTGTPLVHLPLPNTYVGEANRRSGWTAQRQSKSMKRKSDCVLDNRRAKRAKLEPRPVLDMRHSENAHVQATSQMFVVPSEGRCTSCSLTFYPHSHTAADICFARISLFYTRPSRQPKTKQIVLGLPRNREYLLWNEKVRLH